MRTYDNHSPLFINSIEIATTFARKLPYNPNLKLLAREKRKERILCEMIFWENVHKGKFHKINFDRERIIGNYIVDFYVKRLGLVIEVDGRSYDFRIDYDRQRQNSLESFGLKFFRVQNIDIIERIDLVMSDLEEFIICNYGIKESLVI